MKTYGNKPGQKLSDFERIGYFLEFMTGDKFIGTLIINEPDRDCFGYYSRRDDISNCDIKLDSGKVIKAGTHFFTRLYPLCGKFLGKDRIINFQK